MRLVSIARIAAWTRRVVARAWSTLDPRPAARNVAAAGRDLCRSRRELIVENGVLRHQLGILRRRSQRPRLHLMDRLRLLLGAHLLEHWRAAIVVVQPDTLIRWHRAGIRLFDARRLGSRGATVVEVQHPRAGYLADPGDIVSEVC